MMTAIRYFSIAAVFELVRVAILVCSFILIFRKVAYLNQLIFAVKDLSCFLMVTVFRVSSNLLLFWLTCFINVNLLISILYFTFSVHIVLL
jgi:hypothetical protein